MKRQRTESTIIEIESDDDDDVQEIDAISPHQSSHHIPTDILMITFSYLSLNEILTCSQVCNQWRFDVIGNDMFWELFVQFSVIIGPARTQSNYTANTSPLKESHALMERDTSSLTRNSRKKNFRCQSRKNSSSFDGLNEMQTWAINLGLDTSEYRQKLFSFVRHVEWNLINVQSAVVVSRNLKFFKELFVSVQHLNISIQSDQYKHFESIMNVLGKIEKLKHFCLSVDSEGSTRGATEINSVMVALQPSISRFLANQQNKLESFELIHFYDETSASQLVPLSLLESLKETQPQISSVRLIGTNYEGLSNLLLADAPIMSNFNMLTNLRIDRIQLSKVEFDKLCDKFAQLTSLRMSIKLTGVEPKSKLTITSNKLENLYLHIDSANISVVINCQSLKHINLTARDVSAQVHIGNEIREFISNSVSSFVYSEESYFQYLSVFKTYHSFMSHSQIEDIIHRSRFINHVHISKLFWTEEIRLDASKIGHLYIHGLRSLKQISFENEAHLHELVISECLALSIIDITRSTDFTVLSSVRIDNLSNIQVLSSSEHQLFDHVKRVNITQTDNRSVCMWDFVTQKLRHGIEELELSARAINPLTLLKWTQFSHWLRDCTMIRKLDLEIVPKGVPQIRIEHVVLSELSVGPSSVTFPVYIKCPNLASLSVNHLSEARIWAPELKELTVKLCSLSTIGFLTPVSLRKMDLSPIVSSDMSTWTSVDFSQLEQLDIVNPPTWHDGNDSIVHVLRNATLLESIHLTNYNERTISFVNKPRLTTIQVQNCPHLQEIQLENLDNLVSLIVNDSSLRAIEFGQSQPFTKLRMTDLRRTKLTDSTIQKLLSLAPNMKIINVFRLPKLSSASRKEIQRRMDQQLPILSSNAPKRKKPRRSIKKVPETGGI